MNSILSIANVVFKESLRNKVIISLIALSFIIIFISAFLDPIALGEKDRIVKDIGLGSISLFNLMIILLAGTRLIYQEIDKKTIYLIVTKPVSRTQIILGKFLGLMYIIDSICISTGLFLIAVMLIFRIPFSPLIILSIVFILLQFTLLASIVIFFSTFTSPVMAGFFTMMTYIVGYLVKDLQFFIEKVASQAVAVIIRIIVLIIPNFYYTDIKLNAVNNMPVSGSYIIFTVSYMLLYTVFFLYISSLIFQKREFN